MKTFLRIFAVMVIGISMALIAPASGPAAAKGKVNINTAAAQPDLGVELSDRSITIPLGQIESRILTITNEGTEDVEFFMEEVEGTFDPSMLSASKAPAMESKWVKSAEKKSPFKALVKAEKSTAERTPKKVIKQVPKNAGAVLESWDSGLGTNVAFGVAVSPPDDNSTDDNSTDDNATVWVSSSTKRTIQGFNVDGTSLFGADFSAPSEVTGLKDLTYNWNTSTFWGLSSNASQTCIYEFEPTFDPMDPSIGGYTDNSICLSGATSQSALAYEPFSDTYFSSGTNQIIYRFDSAGTIKSSISISGIGIPRAITGLAFNPETRHLFAMVAGTGTVPSKIYVLIVGENSYTVDKSFSIAGFSNAGAAGLEIDCQGMLWAVDKVTGFVYQVESDEVNTICREPSDVIWLYEDPSMGYVEAGGATTVEITFDSSDGSIEQGTYTATLLITNLATNKIMRLPLSMTVADVADLQVFIKPANIGGEWQIDGGPWLESAYQAEVTPDTPHVVTFKDVEGYITPAETTVTIPSGGKKQLTVTYVPSGKLTVNFVPADTFVKNNAKWQLDGKPPWRAGGTSVYLPKGNHTVTFKKITGYKTPDAQSVTITQSGDHKVTGDYVENGSITITIDPKLAVTRGAKWMVDGGGQQKSGTTKPVEGEREYTISFTAADEFATPQDLTVYVGRGQAVKKTVTYSQAGTLIVAIAPPEIKTKAAWRVVGGDWQKGGAELSLAAGNYTVEFKEVDGWATPDNLNVKVIANKKTTAKGTYLKYGTVTVKILPKEAINKNAKWRIDTGEWNESGAKVSLAPGTYKLNFSSIAGFRTKPKDRNFTIESGDALKFTGTYAR